MNQVNLLGRITRDPDIRYSQGEKSTCVAKFSLAVNRKFKKDEADFINCIAFGKTAELIEKYIRKGSQLAVTGSIQTGSYTNKDGNKVYTTDVLVSELDFCGGKNETSNQGQPASDGFMNIPDGIDEELPFN